MWIAGGKGLRQLSASCLWEEWTHIHTHREREREKERERKRVYGVFEEKET
mgnify:CR=1 FL=1